MTQLELNTLIKQLICCSSTMAYEFAIKLANGDKCNINNLIILNSYIDYLLKYDLNNEDNNCLTSDQFNNIIDNAKNACNVCNCD